jgi:predicted ATPase
MILRAVRRRRDAEIDDAFPWSVPALRGLTELKFTSPVTFLIGENGTGKSTLLEALAVAAETVAVGAQDVAADPTLAGPRRLAAALQVVWARHAQTRLFFRAEDAFGFTRSVERTMREIDAEADAILSDETAGAEARKRAAGFVRAQRHALAQKYGDDPHARSHGETFLGILRGRLAPGGLYLLDEPETPLSPTRVLALLAILHDAVATGSQFIIATHSPILAAFPGATILVFESGALVETPYEELEHVRVTRDFLNAPQRYLRRLTAPRGEDEEPRSSP